MDIPPVDFAGIASLQMLGTICFALAVIHTFLVKPITVLSHRFPEGSARNTALHYLGEVEVVFGFWAFLFLLISGFLVGLTPSVAYLDTVNFTEPVFVFCIMCISATRPILHGAQSVISMVAQALSKATTLPRSITEFFSILTIGPLLGSFITEPAAMTVVALLIKKFLDARGVSTRFKYAVIGLLFVNISIGGVLTNFAAPPVLMVAKKFGWSSLFMLKTFGIKTVLSIVLGTLATTIIFRNDIARFQPDTEERQHPVPIWMTLVHVGFMLLVVVYHKHIPFFLGLFLLFLGWTEITRKHQSPLKIRESLLVGFFLAGLVALGAMQAWWLEPTLTSLSDHALFFGAAGLTAVTDNAALTYLGSLVPTLSESAKYMLVAGAVAGGGLTVIANAPNPAGYGILRDSFGADGISPLYLLAGALPATILTLVLFGFVTFS